MVELDEGSGFIPDNQDGRCIETLGDAKEFTAFEAKGVYWKIYIEKRDSEKTSFISN